MRLLSRIEEVATEGSVVAIGKFDGIHKGHKLVIGLAVSFARERLLDPIVVTFDRHPNVFLNPENVPGSLTGQKQRLSIFESLGVESAMLLSFTEELASLSPEEFVQRHLVPLRVRMIFVGENFRFGNGGRGTVQDLIALGRLHGFDVTAVPNLELGGEKISSSAVRAKLDSGDVAGAAALLGRNHEVTGLVEHGKKLGRTIGFPTANMARNAEGYLPADGIYAGYLLASGVTYPAAHSIGTNDSVATVPRLLESHVIGRDDLELYDLEVTCVFVDKVRGWAKFDSLEALVEQIGKDVARSSEILGGS